MSTIIKAHKVSAARITGVQPLVTNSQRLLGPDAGLILLLENGKKYTWLSEQDGPLPKSGSYLIEDQVLNTHYLADAATFWDLFEEVEN